MSSPHLVTSCADTADALKWALEWIERAHEVPTDDEPDDKAAWLKACDVDRRLRGKR